MQITNNIIKNRDIRLDIIRIFSLFCVISVHFFLNSGFYDEIIVGKQMYLMNLVLSFFFICVPMFIILTGYLMNKKVLSKKYYKGIIKTLIIYIICTIIYSIFIKYYKNENMNIIIFITNLLAYKGTTYAWYIEMYIGLFLLIPFLNLIINNLKNKKEYHVLLGTLILLIGLPSVINCEGIKLLSDWWMGIYPIFYYFLGAYLYRYPVKLDNKINIVLILIIVVVFGTFNFYKSYNQNYIWDSWNGYSSIFVMIESFLVFNLLLRIKFNKNNTTRSKVLQILSEACLGAYLISRIYDMIIYDKLNALIPTVKERFVYAPVTVLICFTCSIITSILINLLYKNGYNLIAKIKSNNKNHKNTTQINRNMLK